MTRRHQPAKTRKPSRRTSAPARSTVRESVLCKPGSGDIQEPPPDRDLRRAEWEQLLALRPGELAPAEVAKCQRRHEMHTKLTLDEFYKQTGPEGASHVGS